MDLAYIRIRASGLLFIRMTELWMMVDFKECIPVIIGSMIQRSGGTA
jgi:hypothetical protein